jgi:Zn-dependent peptidase ImmA (M78 family)
MSDLKGLSGFTCYDQDNDKYGIFLDSSIHFFFPTRTRFTIAHELGHIILGHFDSVHSNSAFIGDPVMEYEANEFAEELLMPTLPIIELHMNNRDIISIYQVSSSAAINKLRFMKRNPIFLKYQAEKEKELSFMRQINTSHHRRDQRDRIVDQLHERWLDPDYAFI